MSSMLRRVAVVVVVVATAGLAGAGCSKKADKAEPAAGSAAAGSAAPAVAVAVAKDPEAAKKLLAAGAAVIDVRTADEFAGEHLDRAENIPVAEIGQRLAEVEKLVGGDKTKPIVVYCGSGKRAAAAKQQLEAAGYTGVVNGGGIEDLK